MQSFAHISPNNAKFHNFNYNNDEMYVVVVVVVVVVPQLKTDPYGYRFGVMGPILGLSYCHHLGLADLTKIGHFVLRADQVLGDHFVLRADQVLGDHFVPIYS